MGLGDWLFGEDPEQIELDRRDTELAHGDTNQKWLRSGYHSADDRDAPTARTTSIGQMQTYGGANINQNPQEQFRQNQQQLVGTLQQQAAGQGPSVAGAQFKAAADANLAQQQALAAGARGGGVGAAARMAAQQGSAGIQQAAQGAAIGRQQEQLNAQQQLGGLISGARGQDIGLAGDQASLDQQAGLTNMAAQNQRTMSQAEMNQAVRLANQQAGLQQTGLNDARQSDYMKMLLGQDQSELDARMQQDALRVSQRDPGSGGNLGMVLGAAAQGAGAAATMSDKNQKTNVEKGSGFVDRFWDQFGPKLQTQPQARRDVSGQVLSGLTQGAQAFKDARNNMAAKQDAANQVKAKQQAASDRLHKTEMLAYEPPEEQKPFVATPGYAAVSGRGMAAGDISDMRMKTNIQPAGRQVDQMGRQGFGGAQPNMPPRMGGMMGAGRMAAPAPQQPNMGSRMAGVGGAMMGGGNARPAAPAGAGAMMGAAQPKQPPVNNMFGAGMAGGFMSDKGLKTALDSNESKLDKFMEELEAYEYDYKNPERHGSGRHVGVMAQDMEKSELGKQMVEETPEGKMIVPDMGTVFASLARLQERMSHLDKRLGKKAA